jgi:hypothetical protein
MLIVALMLGVILAVAAVLAIWLALGRWTLMWRVSLAILGASGGGIIFCALSGELQVEWLALVWVVVVTIAAMFAVVRWVGFKLVDATSGSRLGTAETQFSVTQLMVLTSVVGATAAGARLLAPLVATINALVFGLTIAVCLGTLALVAAWAMLGSETTRIKLLALAVVTVIVTGLVYCGMEITNADPGIVWASVVVVYTLALAGLLLLMRSGGYRLHAKWHERPRPCGAKE